MNKFVMILAALTISSVANAAIDSRVVGSWKSPCTPTSGVYSNNVMTFTAEGSATTVDNAEGIATTAFAN